MDPRWEAEARRAEALATLAAREVDLVVSDIGMPGGDGYGLVERIRRVHRRRPLPVIALTAYASPAEHEAIVRAGFQLHLRKPIDPEELAHCLSRVCWGSLATPAGS